MDKVKKVEPKKAELSETIGRLKNEIEQWKTADETLRSRLSRILEIQEDGDHFMGGGRGYATADWLRIAFEIGKLKRARDIEFLSNEILNFGTRLSKIESALKESKGTNPV